MATVSCLCFGRGGVGGVGGADKRSAGDPDSAGRETPATLAMFTPSVAPSSRCSASGARSATVTGWAPAETAFPRG